MTAVDKPTQKEVEMFLIAIQKNPPTMNLDGYADINRGLITAVCKHFVAQNCESDLDNHNRVLFSFSECFVYGNLFSCFTAVQANTSTAKYTQNGIAFIEK